MHEADSIERTTAPKRRAAERRRGSAVVVRLIVALLAHAAAGLVGLMVDAWFDPCWAVSVPTDAEAQASSSLQLLWIASALFVIAAALRPRPPVVRWWYGTVAWLATSIAATVVLNLADARCGDLAI